MPWKAQHCNRTYGRGCDYGIRRRTPHWLGFITLDGGHTRGDGQ